MTRIIYFVRHGQEQSSVEYNSVGGNLSSLGVEQAIMTSMYFKDIELDNVYASPLPRAMQTAQLIIKNHPYLTLKTSELLCEGIPNIPVGYHDEFPKITKSKLYQTAQQFNLAYHEFVRPTNDCDANEIVVAHNNIIRFFLVNALNAPKESWIKFELYNCSITKVVIYSSSKFLIEYINATAHLQKSHITYY